MSDSTTDPADQPDSEPSWTALAGIISDAEAEKMLAQQAEMRTRSSGRIDRIVELLREK